MKRVSNPGGAYGWSAFCLTLVIALASAPGTHSEVSSFDSKDWCAVTCHGDWDPICATNGVTYVNDCFLHKAIMCIGVHDLVEVHRGPCSPCPTGDCPLVHEPVCGTDGHTYINPCALRVANDCRSDVHINISHMGACAPNPANPFCRSYRSCRRTFMPVCGSDGRTYGNECELNYINDCRVEEDKIKLVNDGECFDSNHSKDPCLDPTYAKANTDCHSTKHPVCGANGRTYENWRQLQQENDQRMDAMKVDIAYMGVCRPSPYADDCVPTTQCPTTIDPLCGSNGKTYINQCDLFRENECRKPQSWIHFMHNGPCRKGMSKEGALMMRIILFLVVFVVACAIFVPIYYARKSYRLVNAWNATVRPQMAATRGPYQLVATVNTDSQQITMHRAVRPSQFTNV